MAKISTYVQTDKSSLGLDERAEIPVIRKLKLEVFGNYFLPHRHRPYREKQTALFF
jgi:hypothetical protein